MTVEKEASKLCAIVLIFLGSSLLPCAAAAQTPNPREASGQFTGPGSCSSTSCHGSVKPREESRVLQNEYSIWIAKDKHSRAYQALSTPVSQRMARILQLGAKPEQSPKCLACHALSVSPEKRARTFELNEGVSCENCHGPASGWLGPHTTRGWTHENSISAGMYDTRNVIRRTEKCLSCHLGTKEKFVDHEMIAAGHPDLYFELDSFSAVMPRHWKTPRENAPGQPAEDSAWSGVREWGAGQAVQLRALLERLAWRAEGSLWPEYSDLQCFACHHALTPPEQSWRQERGYAGRRPGDPPWDASRYAVFRHLALQTDAAATQELERKLAQLAQEMSKLNPGRQTVLALATSAAPAAQRLAERLESAPYDSAAALRLLERIAGSAEEISQQGERAAEQAAMALDSLCIAYTRTAKPANAAEVRAALNGLFQQLENPSRYQPDAFARQMRKVGALLR